ncbi:MAG TPA: nucleotide sugar dehydrogenase, partial [Planctomycetota bacterium]|nr:nucleotide sugar dehydrogenase [Planctomycetota bacterium]
AVMAGRSYVEDVPAQVLAGLVAQRKLEATTDLDALSRADAVVICVPTPLRKTKDPDVSFVLSAVRAVAARAHPDMLVVLESTTYPGTTEELLVPELEKRGLVVGETVFVAFSGERVDPGNRAYGLRNTPKVLGGATPRCTAVARELYSAAVSRLVEVSSPRAAEMVKLIENTFRLVNIGFVNEVAQECDKMGLDVWEILDAAATKPFGFMKFTPGPGLGGHCIPIVPLYLSWKLKERNFSARFIELADDVNSHMPDFVVQKALVALNDAGKCAKGARVLVLGVAYKPDVSDASESPAIPIMKALEALGAVVDYHDPHVPSLERAGLDRCSVSTDPTPEVRPYDLVLIATGHSCVDWAKVVHDAALVLDCRDATREVTVGREKIVRL